MYLLAPFILQNHKKILRADPGPKMAHLSWANFFRVQTIIITFIYLLTLFTVQNLKKSLEQIQSYEDAPFFAPKWSICPKQFFFFENY